MNGMGMADVRDRKMGEIIKVVEKWGVQGTGLEEVGINWQNFPLSLRLSSWFRHNLEDVRVMTA